MQCGWTGNSKARVYTIKALRRDPVKPFLSNLPKSPLAQAVARYDNPMVSFQLN